LSVGETVEPSGFFVLRTPLLPFATLPALSEGLEAPSVAGDPTRLRDAWWRDLARIRQRLRTLVRTPVVREAVFVASPALDGALDDWLSGPDHGGPVATDRAVLKYVARMAARATPFGLFAGCGLGVVGGATRLNLAPRAACRRHTRLDMEYLVLLADLLARDPSLAAAIRYTPNSSLYRIGDRWRYVETRWQGRDRSQHLVAIEDTAALSAVLGLAHVSASRADLAARLVDDAITAPEADAFVAELIEQQVLVPDLECPITGGEPLDQLGALLRRSVAGTPAADALAAVGAELARLDAVGPGVAPSWYLEIAQRLEALPAPVDPGRLFQVDLVRPAGSATLDRALADEIVRGAEVLRRLVSSGRRDALQAFRAAFAERYGAREVPLVEALDEESGVGAALVEWGQRDAAPLLRGLTFPPAAMAPLSWGAREALLLRRVGEVLIAGGRELALTPADIAAMDPGDAPALPDAYSVQATLVGAASGERIGADCRVLLQSVSGPSGARLLGRFCHADPELTTRVVAHLRDEEALDPDAVFAEVVHLPEGRLGNVLLRPVLRAAEIAYLGRSGAPADRQIAVTDLTLRLVDERFELRSRRLGRRIVPRLTSAHNFGGLTLNLYRLLGLLQGEGRLADAAWDWGPLADLPFLPRVTFGRLVFTRAAWSVRRDEVRGWCESGDGAAQFAAVQRWRAARGVPRWAVLADHDNTLAIDFDNALSVDVLIRLLQDREAATLTELYPGPDDLCVTGEDGGYVHELLVPCVARDAMRPRRPAPPAAGARRRVFAPGSEWVFARLDTGSSTADRLLAAVIGPVSRALWARGLINRWFFVRYADPDEHLRWRLHAADRRSAAAVRRRVERAVADAMADRLVRRLAFDTYEREVERYGGDAGIAAAEHWFWADSEAVVDLLGHAASGDDQEWRWKVALPGVDALLADLGFDLEARLQLARERRAAFGREFRADAAFGRQLAARFRGVRLELERMLDPDRADASAPWRAILMRRSQRAREALAALCAAGKAGSRGVEKPALAASLAHMHLNRLFRAEQRAHELVVYDFLSCLYQAQIARRRRGASALQPGTPVITGCRALSQR
jgi:thiopeptide-type bacteriocin biosynthesis protein